jgi:hemerythrin-like domain-containing protein
VAPKETAPFRCIERTHRRIENAAIARRRFSARSVLKRIHVNEPMRNNSRSGARSVREFLGADRRRLDAALRDAARLAHGGAFEAAAATFDEFRRGLDRHIDMEERILFPSFAELTGAPNGPASMMHLEHTRIRRLMNTIDASLRAKDFAAFLEAIREFTTLLEEHNDKEDNVLYPMIDRALGSDRERDEIVRRMERL